MRLHAPRAAALGLAAAVLLGSCASRDSGPAVLWTDVPEIALAVELFNASQERCLVELAWRSPLAEALRQAKRPPSLVVGRYLKSQALRDRFQSLDYLFGELVVNQAAFYPGLLALGNVEGRQLLLPVSFNAPAIVFPKGFDSAGDGFLIRLQDMAPAARDFNRRDKGAYSRMGFSPRWDGNFLALAVDAEGAGFREGKGLAWSEEGLAAALESMRAWSAATNGPASAEDDFQFKYLYSPPYQYVAAGRALFAYVESSALFGIPEEKREGLDYRWFASSSGKVPVSDGLVYAAIPRSGGGKDAAEAFLKWLFREDSQKAILEYSRATRASELSFGLLGGFSSLKAVNERAFPLYYPALVGHLPPAEALVPPNVLPSDWPELKAQAVAPWLVEAAGRAAIPSNPGEELAERVAEHYKKASQR